MSMMKIYVALSEEKLEKLKENQNQISDFIWAESDKSNRLDIDKAWHGIHYILTGDAQESDSKFNNVIFGGESMEQDIGYGPAQYLTVNEVKENSKLLQDFTTEKFRNKFKEVKDEIVEKGIYPFYNDWTDEDIEYLLEHYKALQLFYQKSAANNLAILHALV